MKPHDVRVQVAETPEEQTSRIVDALTAEKQFRETVHGDEQRVAFLRSCGRAAGRAVGVRVRTFVTDRADGAVDVWVVDVTEPDPDDELAMVKQRKAMEEAIRGLGF